MRYLTVSWSFPADQVVLTPGLSRSLHIVELDGGREGPLDRGKTKQETFLEVSLDGEAFAAML